MQPDDELTRDLVALRHKYTKAARPRDAMQACAIALARCQSAGCLLPIWLYDALMSHLDPVTNKERQEEDYDANAIRRLQVLVDIIGEKEPTAKDYRTVSERLTKGGDRISEAGIKKLWQRHGQTFLTAMKYKERLTQ